MPGLSNLVKTAIEAMASRCVSLLTKSKILSKKDRSTMTALIEPTSFKPTSRDLYSTIKENSI